MSKETSFLFELSILFVMFVDARAQIPIRRDANSLRNGDQLCKILVDYVDPGDRGSAEIWHLGSISTLVEEYRQVVSSAGDTIAIFEPENIRHYIMRGDTLFEKGTQSRRAYCLYSEERPVLHYPFQYGDSISGSFSGGGRDENTRFCSSGWGYTVADGLGMLTDGIDTLRHVTRLHLHDEYTVSESDSSSMLIESDRYAWYCAGCRYPVMESWHRTAILDSIHIPLDSISCLYLPIMQGELTEDLANQDILQGLASVDSLNAGTSPLVSIHAGLSADGMSILIDFSLLDNADIGFVACDILGFVLGQVHYENREAGDWRECLILTRRPIGNTLMLNIKCGGQEITNKVVCKNIFN